MLCVCSPKSKAMLFMSRVVSGRDLSGGRHTPVRVSVKIVVSLAGAGSENNIAAAPSPPHTVPRPSLVKCITCSQRSDLLYSPARLPPPALKYKGTGQVWQGLRCEVRKVNKSKQGSESRKKVDGNGVCVNGAKAREVPNGDEETGRKCFNLGTSKCGPSRGQCEICRRHGVL